MSLVNLTCFFVSTLALAKCPDQFPYPVDEGHHCCLKVAKKNDTSLAADCNGKRIGFSSSLECCRDEEFVPCSDARGCNTALSETIHYS